MHNSSNIIAADGLSVMNFFWGNGMGCEQPVLEAVSNKISFKNPNAPVWPRLALGEEWDTVSSQHHISLCLSLSNVVIAQDLETWFLATLNPEIHPWFL